MEKCPHPLLIFSVGRDLLPSGKFVTLNTVLLLSSECSLAPPAPGSTVAITRKKKKSQSWERGIVWQSFQMGPEYLEGWCQ